VTDAEVADSLHVRVGFDDHLEPSDSIVPVQGRVVSLPDSAEYALVVGGLHPTIYERQRPVPADTGAAADTLAPRLPPRGPPRRDDDRVVPSRDLIVRLDRPLRPGRYVITLTNAVNINRLTGGGADDFEVRAPAPVRRDTTAAMPRRIPFPPPPPPPIR